MAVKLNIIMNIRDRLNTQERYQEIIDKKTQYINEDLIRIQERKEDEKNNIQQYPKPNIKIIKSISNSLVGKYINLLQAEYSVGSDFIKIKEIFSQLLGSMEISWNLKSVEDFKHGFDEDPYYTTDNYQQILTLVSLGVLLEVGNADFDKIIKIRDKVKNSDQLLDFLINYRVKREFKKTLLKYNKYTNIQQILDVQDKTEVIKSLKKYLSKQWFKDFGKMANAETHKSKWNIHTGYWSWEAGAIAKILNLDDSSLKDQQYYPYDMVHFKD